MILKNRVMLRRMFPTLISGTYLECMAHPSRVYGRNQGNTEHT